MEHVDSAETVGLALDLEGHCPVMDMGVDTPSPLSSYRPAKGPFTFGLGDWGLTVVFIQMV